MARRDSRGSRPSALSSQPPAAHDPSDSDNPGASRVSVDRVAEPAVARARPTLFDAEPPGVADWRAILAGRRPAEVLTRLVDGDPLGLRQAAFTRARQGGWLVDVDRVHLRAIARCAQRGVEYRGHPAIDEWLAEIVDEAILDLLREDAEALAAGVEPTPADAAHWAALARPLGLDVRVARALGVAFHTLPREVRVAFRRVAIEAQAPAEVARQLGREAALIVADARRAFECLLSAEDELLAKSGDDSGAST